MVLLVVKGPTEPVRQIDPLLAAEVVRAEAVRGDAERTDQGRMR